MEEWWGAGEGEEEGRRRGAEEGGGGRSDYEVSSRVMEKWGEGVGVCKRIGQKDRAVERAV